jgi:arginase family enzyme
LTQGFHADKDNVIFVGMGDRFRIADFLSPISKAFLSGDQGYVDGQIGHVIETYESEFPDMDLASVVLVGCGEMRGTDLTRTATDAPDIIRKHFYRLFYWHTDIELADVGNIRIGHSLNDTYAALSTVVKELIQAGKTVIILGGSQDLTLAQYRAYGMAGKIIEATGIDARIDLYTDSVNPAEHFLMEMLTGTPNFIRHYNHIGFQSYYVHPGMLETLDKLRFDCYRVGSVKESIDEMEPVIRNSHLISFDIQSLAQAFSPASTLSPNGFNGEEACVLMRYAGLSPTVNTIGLYGYETAADRNGASAEQLAHMIWYVLDGRSRGRREAHLDERDAFNEYIMAFAEVQTIFLQSKKTGRWWMQLPDKQFIACSYKDYLLASSNEIPERWLRAQERG